MNGKTCLLCGKPMGRIRVGAAGDFCSREHRNQYRLRRSMDCLTEANKVSALARRRENPKPIAAGGVLSAGATAPQAFLAAQPFGGGAPARPVLKSRKSEIRRESHLAPAGLVAPPGPAKPARNVRREAGMKLSVGQFAAGGRVAPIGRGMPPGLTGPPALKPAQSYSTVQPAPRIGNALRVSARGSFPKPERKLKAARKWAKPPAVVRTPDAKALPGDPATGSVVQRAGTVEIRREPRPPALRREFGGRRDVAPSHPRPERTGAGKPILPRIAAVDLPACSTPRTVVRKLRVTPARRALRADLEEAALPALRTARLRAVRRKAASGTAGARLSFDGMTFTGAPDPPAQIWVGDTGQELRKS